MTIYVDNMRGDARIDRGGRTIAGRWSHLLADDPTELAAFAADLGLRPDWLQQPGTPREHYDVVEAVRRRAVGAGAVPISYPGGTENVVLTKRLQASALDAVSRGWQVFPLRPGTKTPAVRDWGHRATADPDRVRELWTVRLQRDGWHVPEPPNVGIACGPSMLVVVDLDVEKPGRDRANWPKQWLEYDLTSGAETLAAVADLAFQTVPTTYAVATPSGGRHLYFDAPASAVIRNSVGHPGPMIDVRGVGGYVVAAGSRLHPSLGPDDEVGDWKDLAYRLLDDRPTADLPGWLTTAVAAEQDWDASPTARRPSTNDVQHRDPDGRSEKYGEAALRGEVDRIRSAPVGQRNHTLNSAAYSLGQLVAAGALTHDRVVEALTDAAGSAGLTASEIATTLDSGLTAGAKNPRLLEQPQNHRSREGAHPHPTAGEQHQQAIGADRQTDYKSALGALDRAFDQAAAVAVETATRLVTDAASDERAALLREAATRIARLVDVDGIDGQSALDALTTAAGEVGMVKNEIEAAIVAGFARSQNPADVDDNRPPPVTSGSVVSELAARRKQSQFDAAKAARERDTPAEQHLGPEQPARRPAVPPDGIDRVDKPAQSVDAPLDEPERSQSEPGQGPPNSGVKPVGLERPRANEQEDRPATATIASGSVGAERLAEREADPPYVIYEVDAAHAGWLFAEAWEAFSTDRRPCYPADTLRIACEGERLPTLGKSDRRITPPPRAALIETPGEELVHREVWESWSQSQRDEWYFARHDRARAAAADARGHQDVTNSPASRRVVPLGLPAAAEEGAGAERLAAGSVVDRPVDADALVRGLLVVLQSRGVIDRSAWDATVIAVAKRSAAAESRDAPGVTASRRPDPPASVTEASAEELDARQVSLAGRSDTTGHADAAAVRADVDDTHTEPRTDPDRGRGARGGTDAPPAAPAVRKETPPGELRHPDSLKAKTPPAEAPHDAPDPHVVLDEAIGQARAAVNHLEATRASRHQSHDKASDAVHNERPAYWAEPEVEL